MAALMVPAPVAPTRQVRIDHYSAVHVAAETARAVARECALPGAMPDQAAVVASELASNIDKHARDGVLYVQPLPLGGGLEVVAADRGPGIAEVARCLADGYTTTGTLGAGLGAVGRIATELAITSRTDTGTVVCARLALPGRREAARQPVGLVCLSAAGEEDCGDAAAVLDLGGARTALVVDGLGHGREAAEAAQAAVRSFRGAAEGTLPEIMAVMHRALRHSRGAAVALLRLRAGEAEYCGIGNVRMVALSPDEVHHRLTGQPGVVGWRMPAPRTHRVPLTASTTTALHTDGIDLRWAHTPPAHLLRLPAPLLAATVAHGYHRTRDDATVVAARAPDEPS
ncbi:MULTISPECIES: SpoIIE family protein phosphatase [unclassified Streptomyces]|uniref:SpoIIE family protein phosphatase n=1 Tax=unclassified Streptomyces TaxID=2593676 RepID=UPI002E314F62|nr:MULTISPECIES: SpoIIE family protein phosphatase [unclassified Streptomyces]